MKRAFLLGLAAVAAVGGAANLAAAPANKAVASKDWTGIVAATPEGGFRVGNPRATVKLIEYGSLTCDHCAKFAEEGLPRILSEHVKSGRLSFEFRNFVRDPSDMAAALLSHCAGPGGFFALADDYFSAQRQWMGRFQGMTPDQIKSLDGLPAAQQLPRIAAIGGLDAMAAKAGVPAAKAQQCLSDEAAIEKFVAMRKVAIDTHKLQGTPTFILNGETVEAHNWSALQPLLGSPGG